MDTDARDSCLRAVRLVARNARLCASIDRMSPQYLSAVESSERMVERAQNYYNTMKQGHELTERAVRLVATALVEARQCAVALGARLAEPEDFEAMAGKIERAITRAEGLSTPPPED